MLGREATMADSDDEGFITLPPGIFDTSTLKAMPKPERPRREADDIVFVPVTPGMPAPSVEEPPAEALSAPAGPPPGAPAAPPMPAQHVEAPTPSALPPAASWTLVLADGSEVPVRGVLLLGRNPAPFPAWPNAQLLAVADTTQSVSKTHV